MAINQILINNKEMVHTEFACTQESNIISIPTTPAEVDFCYCDFECEYEEMKFASADGLDYKNDLSYYLSELVDSGGSIIFKMFKDGQEISVIIDDTYGTYTPVGGFSDHPLKSGFIADWNKIYFLLGGGHYYFSIEVINFSRSVIKETGKIKLSLFSEVAANGTVVIKTTQNGYIQSGFDYTGMNWGTEFRIGGKLIYQAPEFFTQTYLLSDRTERQIQDQIINNYLLECDFIPSLISRELIENSLLANEYIVIDYNLWNDANLTYSEKSLYPTGIEEATYFERSRNGNFGFTFSDKKKNIIKRNYK